MLLYYNKNFVFLFIFFILLKSSALSGPQSQTNSISNNSSYSYANMSEKILNSRILTVNDYHKYLISSNCHAVEKLLEPSLLPLTSSQQQHLHQFMEQIAILHPVGIEEVSKSTIAKLNGSDALLVTVFSYSMWDHSKSDYPPIPLSWDEFWVWDGKNWHVTPSMLGTVALIISKK